MPVPSIDQYFGLGKGDAQIYNTNNALNTLFKVQAQQQAQDQSDQKAVADMLSKIQPDKLRTKDMDIFNQKYGELKRLYTTNKDLYRHPLKNMESYSRAQQLTGELQQLNAKSQQVEKWRAGAASAYLNDPDKFEDYTVKLLGEIDNLSIPEIEKQLGGRLPDLQDIQFAARPIDWGKIQKDVFNYGAAAGQVNEVPVTVKADGKNGIPTGKLLYRMDKVISPTATGAYTERLMLEDKNFKKSMANEFKSLTPESLASYNQAFAQRFPTAGFSAGDPLTYAKAEVFKRNNTLQGEGKPLEDEGYNRSIKEMDKADDRAWETKKQIFGNKLAQGNILLSHALREQEKSDKAKDDSLLLQQSRELVGALGNKDASAEDIKNRYSKVIKVGQNVAGEPLWVTPTKDGKTVGLKAYLTAIAAKNQNALEDKYKVSPEMAEEAFKKGVKIAYIPVWSQDASGKSVKRYVSINPLSYSAAEDAYSTLKLLGGTEKQGIKAK